jgi:hypothetical protein
MMIFKKAIPRRTFLRGAGASIALPFLDAMVPAFAATSAWKQPLRLGYVYLPIGRIMDNWTPKTEGANYEMTPTLAPLAPYRDQMLIMSGLDIKAADLRPGEKGGTHARPCAAYLTGVHPYDNSVGISADQIIAKKVGQHTQLASLQLGLDPAEWAGGSEVDYDGFYRSTLSWSSATTPLPTQDNPRKVFERLFGDTDTVDAVAMRQRIEEQSSVLDSVNSRAKRLMKNVNSGDRYKIEEYLDAVRDIERGIQVAESKAATDDNMTRNLTRPSGIPDLYADHAKLIFDLMFLAYQTDMTRVVAFMMGHEGTNRNYLELGAQDGNHSMSHHKGNKNAIEALKKINMHQSELLAYFLNKMKTTTDGETSLLDNSMIIVGSALSDGNLHLHNDVPTLVLGSAQGKVQGGRHVRYNSEPLSNLHMATMDMFDAPSQDFVTNDTSDATGILPGLV